LTDGGHAAPGGERIGATENLLLGDVIFDIDIVLGGYAWDINCGIGDEYPVLDVNTLDLGECSY
jgi:hypothetical protein